jgi:O-methyltransferase
MSGPRIRRMRVRRRLSNFFIKTCGLRRLHGGGAQRFVRAVLDEIDLQHLRDVSPCHRLDDRNEMYRYVHEACVKSGPVDYLEFGVFNGDSIRQWASLNAHPDSRFFGFDSFEGLPEDWRPGQDKGHFSTGGLVPSIDDPRVQFVRGWFENSVPVFARAFVPKNRMILHLDADLYGSTMLPLVHFSPCMTQGTLLIFDEFYDREHEFKALTDWQKVSRKTFRIVAEVGDYCRVCAELA